MLTFDEEVGSYSAQGTHVIVVDVFRMSRNRCLKRMGSHSSSGILKPDLSVKVNHFHLMLCVLNTQISDLLHVLYPQCM
ncbi:hypothetical protein AZE42_07058 [Rhizopogon vesiculosus]|uniref:Uncharacterized protein n=1 Tax=Rhizopogon vesiculosus TaxID=180088 RepID=A0A1J8PX13_9AGAM|nr:hypothetical protein AZE42_07058 [Rhizopogon vesiculosus]